MKIKINTRMKTNVIQILEQIKEYGASVLCLNGRLSDGCMNLSRTDKTRYNHHCVACRAINPEIMTSGACPCLCKEISTEQHIKRLTKVLADNPNV